MQRSNTIIHGIKIDFFQRIIRIIYTFCIKNQHNSLHLIYNESMFTMNQIMFIELIKKILIKELAHSYRAKNSHVSARHSIEEY